MAAKETRAGIASGQDFYLCPLALVQMSNEQILTHLQPVLEERQPLHPVERLQSNGQVEIIARGYEWIEVQEVAGFSWQERRLLIRSEVFAQASKRGLDTRLAQKMSEP